MDYQPLSPTHAPPLWPKEIHLWKGDLDVDEGKRRKLQPWLSADERERARRFRFDRDRHRFTVARGLLRHLLGHYLETAPGSLRFAYNAYGRPSLASPRTSPSLCFNLAHSGPLVLYAFTWERSLGVDVEQIRPDLDHEGIAKRFFSRNERQQLQQLPPAARVAAFFNCWTRKEAYIKAEGQGLSLPLTSFDVSLLPDEPAQLLSTRERPGTAREWSLLHLSPAEGYTGALAARGKALALTAWQCDLGLL